MEYHVDFQTQHEESNGRMNQALTGVNFDVITRRMKLEFDATNYDSEELMSTIKRHFGKGVQNMRVALGKRKYAMVVTPLNEPYIVDDTTIVSRYEIDAHVRELNTSEE